MVRREVEAGGRRRKSRDALTSRPEIERLLDAACAPASPRELAGEQAAVDLFARARLVTSPVVTAAPRASRAGFKAAAAGVLGVVVFSSGVSFAATGHVPFAGTLHKVTRVVTGQPADDANGAKGHHGDKSHRGDNGTAGPHGPKAAALQGLCQAYAHGKKADHGKAHETRPAQALVTAAGGVDQVDDFCASLPAKAHQGATDVSHPTKQAHPTHPTHPTQPSEGPSSGEPTGPGANNGSNGNHGNDNNGNDPTKPTHPPKPTHTPKPTDDPTHGNGNSNGITPTHTPKPSHTGKPTQTP